MFSDRNIQRFPVDGKPLLASQENKDAAIAFVDSRQAGSASCLLKGLTTALAFANSSTARRNVIIYMGDGGATCPGEGTQAQYTNRILTEVQAQNVKRHQINAIGIGTAASVNSAFLQQLVSQNGGTFRRVAP